MNPKLGSEISYYILYYYILLYSPTIYLENDQRISVKERSKSGNLQTFFSIHMVNCTLYRLLCASEFITPLYEQGSVLKVSILTEGVVVPLLSFDSL